MKARAALSLVLCLAICQPAFAQAPPDEPASAPNPVIDALVPDALKSLVEGGTNSSSTNPAAPTPTPAPTPAKYDAETPGPVEYAGDGSAEAAARAEVERQALLAINARNEIYLQEFAQIRAEDASALKFLTLQCTNNDAPSGDCMNQVVRARKVDQTMQALLAKDGAADYLSKTLKSAWLPESPIRAAAVRMPLELNAGLQAARDYVAKHSFRDTAGGFQGCHAARAAVVAAQGDDMRPADGIDDYAKFIWDPDAVIRDLAALETSGAQGTPVNAYRICVLRARWAELRLQAAEPPPRLAVGVPDPLAGLPRRVGNPATQRLAEAADRNERAARERQLAANSQRMDSERARMSAESGAFLGALTDVALIGAQTYLSVEQQKAQIEAANALAQQQAAAQQQQQLQQQQLAQAQAQSQAQAQAQAYAPPPAGGYGAPVAPPRMVNAVSLEASQCIQVVPEKVGRAFRNGCAFRVTIIWGDGENLDAMGGIDPGGRLYVSSFGPIRDLRYAACREEGLKRLYSEGGQHACEAY